MYVSTFLQVMAPAIDVRSPGEFAAGHIPGSVNIPLLDDWERKEVGTLYKTEGPHPAFLLGLKLIGPKLSTMVEAIHALGKKVRIYCFRGGLRSQSIAELVRTSGCEVTALKGGYKAYRRYCLEQFSTPLNIRLVGGPTGSGKTDFLKTMLLQGEQVVDLEDLASHSGSVFGHFQKDEQPTQEHFENLIAENLRLFDRTRPVWMEDESRMIGKLKIPDPLFAAMQKAPLQLLTRPLEERIDALMHSYGAISLDEFIKALERIRRKLGNVRTQEIMNLAREGKWRESVHLLVKYYDKAYKNSLKRNSDA